MNRKIVFQLLALVGLMLTIAVMAIRRDSRLWGHQIGAEQPTQTPTVIVTDDAVTQAADGTIRVNTTRIGADISGYAGAVPLEVVVRHDTVIAVEALPNVETPQFFNRVVSAGLLDRWNGLPLSQAAAIEVDAVSGATYSSRAVIANLRRALTHYADVQAADESSSSWSWSLLAALVVALLGALLPLWVHRRPVRIVLLLLNVVVLGLWTGSFISYTLLVGIASGGISLLSGLTTIVLLFVAFVYPLLGHQGHYCAHLCPLGSLQELAGLCNPHRKLRLSDRLTKVLTLLRQLLFVALMASALLGGWFAWMDYELFAAFFIRSASVWMLAAAALTVVLSVFVPRPYCRFLCPTGLLMQLLTPPAKQNISKQS